MKPDIDALRTQVIDAARDVVSEWRRMGQEDEVAERERILVGAVDVLDRAIRASMDQP